LGHDARLISPQFVKPYVKGNKNDANDAEAICEAVGRPAMRFVPIKSIEQQDIQMLHRVRSGLVKERTALANRIRGLLAEYGIIVPIGLVKVRQQLPDILEDAENGLTMAARMIFADLQEQLIELDLALQELEQFDPKQAKIIELRYFGGLTIEETAEVLKISPATVKREWTIARAWLYKNINGV